MGKVIEGGWRKSDALALLLDPIQFVRKCWPAVTLYRQQEEILYAVRDCDETVVPAGNMLGKDFIAGIAVLYFFLSRHPCRVVTTSADFSQLRGVLWGEIRRFISTSALPLTVDKGGPLIVNDLHIRKVVRGQPCGISYILGRVAAKGEGMLGHHVTPESGRPDDGIPRTLFVADEASGVDNEAYERATTWAKRMLVIGNPYPCNNFFKRNVKEGSRYSPDGSRCYRKVIRIKAEDSPNVRYAEAEKRGGKEPSGKSILPGVLSWPEYEKRRATWDKIRQCVSLDASFYEGAELLLFPPDWLNRAETLWLSAPKKRKPRAAGIDPAEGGDKTTMVAIDDYGIIEVVSRKTPNTADIPNEAIAFMRKHGLSPDRVCFDRGGGGKQAADQLRERGYAVQTVGFGDPVAAEMRRGTVPFGERRDVVEERTAYKNRRAQMYHAVSELLDPSLNPQGFAIPPDSETGTDLRAQLAPIPKTYNREGQLYLLPKNKQSGSSHEQTLIDLIGHSPDEADALALAVYAMMGRPAKAVVGAAW